MTRKEILEKMDLQRQAYVLRLKEAQDKHLEQMDKLWAELHGLEAYEGRREVDGDTISEARPA